MKFKIASFQPSDLLAVASADLECFGPKEAYPQAFFRQAHDMFGDLFYIAQKRDNQIAGYLVATINPKTNQAWIVVIGVRPGYRRQGAARQLIEHLIVELVKRGVSSITLTVSPGNASAAQLYEKLGFSKQAVIDSYFGPGESRAVFKKKIGRKKMS